MTFPRYSERDRETESVVKEGVHRFRIDGQTYYGVKLDSVPQKFRGSLRQDFKAVSVLADSLDSLNLPEVCLDSSGETEVFIKQDKGSGSTEDSGSFYESAAFYILMSKNDVEGNIVEGESGYAPVDFDGLLRSRFTDEVCFLKYGAEFGVDVELVEQARAEAKAEAERHGISYEPEKLENALKNVAEILSASIPVLERNGFRSRAENLEYNTRQILDQNSQ